MPATFDFKIITLKDMTYENQVQQVSVPTRAGEITVLDKHTPLITLVQPGGVRVVSDEGQEVVLAVSGGFLEVRPAEEGEEHIQVILLADTAEFAEEIDLERAAASHQRAKEAMERKDELSDIDYARVMASLEKELARIKVGTKYQGRK